VRRDAGTIESAIIASRLQFRNYKGRGLVNKLRWLKQPPVANIVSNPSKYPSALSPIITVLPPKDNGQIWLTVNSQGCRG
jgi:hypothetical protein